MKKFLLIFGPLFLLLLLLPLIALNNEAVTRWLLPEILRIVPGKLDATHVSGDLTGPITLRDVRWQDGAITVAAADLSVDWQPFALFAGDVLIESLEIDRLVVMIEASADSENVVTRPWPEYLHLPVDIELSAGRFDNVTFEVTRRETFAPITIERFDIAQFRIGGDVVGWQQLSLSSERVTMKSELAINSNAPYETMLKLRGHTEWQDKTWSLQLVADGTLSDLSLHAKLDQPESVQLDATVDLVNQSQWQGTLTLPGVLLAHWFDNIPATEWQATVFFTGNPQQTDFDLRASGDLLEWQSVKVDANGQINADRLTVKDFNSNFDNTMHWQGTAGLEWQSMAWRAQIRADHLRYPTIDLPLDAQGELTAHGNTETLNIDANLQLSQDGLPISDTPVRLLAALEFENLQTDITLNGSALRMKLEDQVIALHDLSLRLHGPRNRWNIDTAINGELLGKYEKLGAIELRADGLLTDRELQLQFPHLALLDGKGKGNIDLDWHAARRIEWSLDLVGIEPAPLDDDIPAGHIDFQVHGQHQLDTQRHAIQLESLQGKLREQEIRGAGSISWTNEKLRADNLEIRWGDGRLNLDGASENNTLELTLAVPELRRLFNDAAGEIALNLSLGGTPGKPTSRGRLRGQQLSINTLHADSLSLDWNIVALGEQPSTFALAGDSVKWRDHHAKELQLAFDGTREQHVLDLRAAIHDGVITAATSGSYLDRQWQGRFSRLDITSADTGQWTLLESGAIRIAADAGDVARQCLGQDAASLCIAGKFDPQSWQGELTLVDATLDMFSTLLPGGLDYTGRIDAHASASSANDGNATINATLGAGNISQTVNDLRETLLEWKQGELDWQLQDAKWQGDTTLQLIDDGLLAGKGQITLREQRSPLLDLDVRFRTRQFSLVPALFPDISEFSGEFAANFRIRGEAAAPDIAGTASLLDGRARIPRLGIDLQPFSLNAQARGQSITLNAAAQSGGGELVAEMTLGEIGNNLEAEGRLTGNNFLAINTRELEVNISPALELAIRNHEFHVSGELLIPRARIRPRNLSSATLPSEDQRFVGEGQRQADAPEWQTFARVTTRFGDDVTFSGFGLKSDVTGAITVSEEPETPITGSGKLSLVNGTYQAYGRELEIIEGELLYNGQPLSQPGLSIRAVHRVDSDTQVGISLRGALDQPEINLFSTPPMTQTEQLSYLVLGRPLTTATGDETRQLDNASLALGLTSGPLTSTLRRKLDLEDVSFRDLDNPEQASLILGKYLSTDLYVSYGVGLFEAVNTLRLQYRLSRRWTLEAISGLENSADFIYSLER